MVGLAGSLALHAAGLVIGVWFSTTPDFDIELTLPVEVEFGLTDEMAFSEPLAAAGAIEEVEPPLAEPAVPTGDEVFDAGMPLDAGVPDAALDEIDAGVVDAGAPDAAMPQDGSEEQALAQLTDAGSVADGGSELPAATDLAHAESRLPPGAQLAMRIDLDRIGQSTLAPSVARLLDAIPDWRLLLEGSGVDPLRDLRRVLIAAPTLERSRLVMAGEHRHGAEYGHRVVDAIARARGKEARWRRKHGVSVAPWHNLDETDRVIALLGDRHFAISRPDDLPALLAMMDARAKRAHQDELESATGSDALLALGPQEAVRLEVEGARVYARGAADRIPQRLRLSIREADEGGAVLVEMVGFFDDAAQANRAQEYWSAQAKNQPYVRLLGFGAALSRLRVSAEEERLRVVVSLSERETQRALSLLEGLLVPRRASPAAPPPPGLGSRETPKGQ